MVNLFYHKGDLLTSKKLKGRKRFMKSTKECIFQAGQVLDMYDQLTLTSNGYLPVIAMMADDVERLSEDEETMRTITGREEVVTRLEVLLHYVGQCRATLTAVYTLLDSKIAESTDTAAS